MHFETNGAVVSYDFYPSSQKSKDLLILVNGFQRTRQDFRAFCKKMMAARDDIALLSFDNRLSGQTKVLDNSTPFTLDLIADDILVLAKKCMQELSLESFSVLGISMGGMIAQLVAKKFPVNNLFLVSTTAGGTARTWPNGVAPQATYQKDRYATLEQAKVGMARFFGHSFIKNYPLLFEMLCQTIVKAAQDSEFHENSEKQFHASLKFDGVDALPVLRAKKTLIFSGNEDWIIPLENSVYLNRNIPNSQMTIYPGVGHLILIENPDVFIQDVAKEL